MNHKTPRFLTPFLAFVSIATAYTGFYFFERVELWPSFFLAEKIGFALLFGYFAYSVRKWTMDDVKSSSIIISLNIYCLLNVWFAPAHHIAFTIFLIFACFLPFRRRWLFFAIQSASCLAFIITYFVQREIGWATQRMVHNDFIVMTVIVFIFAVALRRYVIDVNSEVQEHLHRTSLVGVEATRLLHDLKGLLSSPIMLLDGLKNREHEISKELMEKHLIALTEDLHNAKDMIKSIHRLVSDDVTAVEHGILACIQSAHHVLHRRLNHVNVKITDTDRVHLVIPDRLHSIFFNLFINSLEAFERKKIVEPIIEIFWHGDDLIYKDNAGGFPKQGRMSSSKGSGSGLGLNLVKHDLHRMGAKMKVTGETNSTSFALSFLKL